MGAHGQLGQWVVALLQFAGPGGAFAQPVLQGLNGFKHQRVDGNGNQRPGQHQALPFGWQQLERHAQGHQNEGELANLRQAGRHRQRRVERVTEGQHQRRRSQRFAQHDDGHHRQHLERAGDQHLGVEQHTHRHKKQHGKSVTQRQRLLRGAVAEFGLAHHHASKKSSQRKRHPKQRGRAEGNTHGSGDHTQSEQLTRPRALHLPQQPGEHPPPHQQHQGHKPADL